MTPRQPPNGTVPQPGSMEVLSVPARNNDVQSRMIALAQQRSGSEAGLFRLYLEIERETGLDEATRQSVLERLGLLIDDLRERRGLGAEPTVEQLLDHYDGAAPAPIDEVRQAYPDARVETATRCELVGGRMRAFPIVIVELDGQRLAFYPEPPARGRPSTGGHQRRPE